MQTATQRKLRSRRRRNYERAQARIVRIIRDAASDRAPKGAAS